MIHEVAHERVLDILAKAGPVELPASVDRELERALHKGLEEAHQAKSSKE